MATLTIWKNGISQTASFDGTPLVQTVLAQAGLAVDQPCGGRGVCGKCAVRLEGQVSPPNAAEEKAGTRLSCQAVLLGDASVWLADSTENRIEQGSQSLTPGTPLGRGIGAAIDIGTTTVVLKLYDLQTGRELAAAACMNPQRAVAADVVGRMEAALKGQGHQLRAQIVNALEQLLAKACRDAAAEPKDVDFLVVAGNTTMLYLLTGRDPECLSHAPFQADDLFDRDDTLLGIPCYYPACMNAFVGADITCAVLASGMDRIPDTALLCDIGTNGELALWKDGKLYVTSTAAGPAFEGAGISCGCGSVTGAIDRVVVENGQIQAHTIGEEKAVGVCGSGLIDAIAAFLETEAIDETGAAEENALPLRDGICLLQKDIRTLQLSKAAIAAGIQTLLESAGVSEDQVSSLYIAGGFGSHLNVASAAAIGLIPASLQNRVQVLGNAALTGAAMMLLDQAQKSRAQTLAASSTHVNLGGNPKFNAHYMEQILFGDSDLFG